MTAEADGHSDSEDESGPCKWGPLNLSGCQKFRNAKCVLFWMCWASGLQGLIVGGAVNVAVTTIERRFEISSTESGLIVSGYDIASAIFLIPVSYFGGFGVKPRYVGIGFFILGLGSLMFSLPHFTTDPYVVTGALDNVCVAGANATTTCTSNSQLSNYKYVFLFAQLLHGIGASPFWTVGVAYLDENLPVRSSSVYTGIFYSFVLIGSAIGYLAGGQLLNIWTDFATVDTSSLKITPYNRRWVGAWWLCFFVAAFVSFLASIPLFGFPKNLPGHKKYKKDREAEVYTKSNKVKAKTTTSSNTSRKFFIKDIFKRTLALLTNPTFMLLNFSSAAEAMLVSGFSTFGPKFLESQFSLTAGTAAMYVGIAAVPAGAGGTFLGGFLVKRFNMKIPGMLKFSIAAATTVFIMACAFLVTCDNVPFAGVNVNYQNTSTSDIQTVFLDKQLDNQCNSNCGCTEEDYHPVCGRDGIMYFSPCYAGCHVLKEGDNLRYNNCTCIQTNQTDYMAEFTSCDTQCNGIYIFMPFFSLMMFFTFLIAIPVLTSTMRCLPEDQRSFGLGIQWVIVRAVGSIPAPILFGKMIDLSCSLWQQRCGDEGSCFFYSNRALSFSMLGLGMTIKFVSGICLIFSLLLYRKPPDDATGSDANKVDAVDLSENSSPKTGTDNIAFVRDDAL